MYANDSSFWKYQVYVDIHRGSCWRGPQMRVGWLTTAIFGDFSGYFIPGIPGRPGTTFTAVLTVFFPVMLNTAGTHCCLLLLVESVGLSN